MLHPRARALSGLAGAALLPLAFAGTALAHRAPTARAAASTITVTEHANTDTEVPAAPGGPDVKGDPLTFVNPVFNAADTKQIGHDEGFCMRLDATAGTWECLWTTFLPGGEITVQGPFYDKKNSVLSITGGTGAYKDARGQMTLTALDGGKKYRFGFQVS